MITILFGGDIVGKPGRDAVRAVVPRLRKSRGVDCVIANAENAAGGSGVTPGIVEELIEAGVDVLTTGDHVWRNKAVFQVISEARDLVSSTSTCG